MKFQLGYVTDLDLRFGAEFFERLGEAREFQVTGNGMMKEKCGFPLGVWSSILRSVLHGLVA